MPPTTRRRHRPLVASTPPPPAPVEVRRAHPTAWSLALHLAGGDLHRLEIDHAGAVIVWNKRRRALAGPVVEA